LAAGGGVGRLGFELLNTAAAGGGGIGVGVGVGLIGRATLLVVGPSMACSNCVRLDEAAGGAEAGGGGAGFEPMNTSKLDPDATGDGGATGGGAGGVNDAGAVGLWSIV